MVSVFPNLCLWRRSLRSNVGRIDPEKLYRATLKGMRLFMCNANLQSACTSTSSVSYIMAFHFGFFNLSGFFQDPHTAVKGKCYFPPHSPQL